MNGDNSNGAGGNPFSTGIGQSFEAGSAQSSGEPASLEGFGAATPRAPEPVIDVSTADFVAEVIEESKTRPVLVDFWAPWCGPCKQLTPILEKVVAAANGAVRLVKMNIDDHPQIPGQMGIQSIPAVVAFVDGRPKDAFMGVQSEAEIKRFIEKLAGPVGPSPVEEMLAVAAQAAEQGAAADAMNAYAAVLQAEPQNTDALAGIGMIYLDNGDTERAKAMLGQVAEANADHPRIAALRSAIDLAEQAENLGDTSELVARIEANPKDWEARFELSVALNAAGRREEAAEQLLEIIRKDRKWRDDGAKTQLLQFFEAWGPADPATLSARRQLSSLLFS